MKRIILLLLALGVVLSLAACGNDSTTSDGNDTNGQTDIQANGEPETEMNGAASSEGPAFDTSWADNAFEALLPELPFSGWITSQPDSRTYKMEISGLNTSAATNAPDSGEPDGADKQKLLDYFETLTSYGFVIEEIGTDYMWKATDIAGNEIEFMCADGGCWITITKAE